MTTLTNERIAEIRRLRDCGREASLQKCIADLLAERESLLADARRWRHVEDVTIYDDGDWAVLGIQQHPEDPSFAAAVDQDIERTDIIKRGGP